MSTFKVVRALALSLIPLGLVACTSATFEPVASAPPVPAQKVAAESVLVLKTAPPTSFQELGEISVEWKGKPDDEAVLRRVREKAADVGANAVVWVDSFGTDSTGFDAHLGGAAEDGPVVPTRSVRRAYTFRAIRLPGPPAA